MGCGGAMELCGHDDTLLADRRYLQVPWHRRSALGVPAPDQQGVGAHKDYGFLALVLQDEFGGLKVESKNGE